MRLWRNFTEDCESLKYDSCLIPIYVYEQVNIDGCYQIEFPENYESYESEQDYGGGKDTYWI